MLDEVNSTDTLNITVLVAKSGEYSIQRTSLTTLVLHLVEISSFFLETLFRVSDVFFCKIVAMK